MYIQRINESIIHLKVYNVYYAEPYTQMIDISCVEDARFDYEDIVIEKIKEAIEFFEQKKKGERIMDATEFAKILAACSAQNLHYVSGYHDTDCCCCCSGDSQPSNIIEGTCKDVTEEEE